VLQAREALDAKRAKLGVRLRRKRKTVICVRHLMQTDDAWQLTWRYARAEQSKAHGELAAEYPCLANKAELAQQEQEQARAALKTKCAILDQDAVAMQNDQMQARDALAAEQYHFAEHVASQQQNQLQAYKTLDA
jgi:hypothetical protein